MSKHSADDASQLVPPGTDGKGDGDGDGEPMLPEEVVEAAERFNNGESVSKTEMLDALDESDGTDD